MLVIQILVLLPLIAGVALVLYGAVTRFRSLASTASALLGILIIAAWMITYALALIVVPLALSIDVSSASLAIPNTIAYSPYLIVGLAAALFPFWIGEAALKLAPSTFRTRAAADASTKIWVNGLRVLGIYLAAFAVLMSIWNSGMLLNF